MGIIKKLFCSVVLLFLSGITLIAQDTTFKILTEVAFLPSDISISEELIVSTKNKEYQSIFKKNKWVWHQHKKSTLRTIEKKSIRSKKNSLQLIKSLQWVYHHRSDSIFMFEKNSIDWDSIQQGLNRCKYCMLTSADVRSFYQGINETLTIDTRKFCNTLYEGVVIDGSPYSVKMVVQYDRHSDTLSFDGNCSGHSYSYKNTRHLLLFYSITQHTKIYRQIEFLNQYFSSKEMLHEILKQYIYDLKHGCS